MSKYSLPKLYKKWKQSLIEQRIPLEDLIVSEENILIRANTIEVEHILQDYMVLIENNFQKMSEEIRILKKKLFN